MSTEPNTATAIELPSQAVQDKMSRKARKSAAIANVQKEALATLPVIDTTNSLTYGISTVKAIHLLRKAGNEPGVILDFVTGTLESAASIGDDSLTKWANGEARKVLSFEAGELRKDVAHTHAMSRTAEKASQRETIASDAARNKAERQAALETYNAAKKTLPGLEVKRTALGNTVQVIKKEIERLKKAGEPCEVQIKKLAETEKELVETKAAYNNVKKAVQDFEAKK